MKTTIVNSQLRKELFLLMNYINAIKIVWTHDPRYITLGVLIQNMAAMAEERLKTIKDFEPYLNVLEAATLARPDCHVSASLFSEASMIIDGYFMSQDSE